MQAIVRDVSARYEAEQAVRQSEERFRLLYQYLPVAYQSLSEHGTIVMVNDAWLALTGLTRGQAVGRRFVDLLASESLDAYESRFRRAILAGDVHDVELTLVRGDRARVTVSIDGRRGQDEHGELRVHCALHDVTAARQADARLRQSEERYRTLFDESPVSLWEEDFSGIRRHLDRLRALGVADFEAHFIAHPEELDDCIGAVRVVDVNRATLALYGADSRSQMLAGLDRIIGDDGRDVFRALHRRPGRRRPHLAGRGPQLHARQPADSPRAPLVGRARGRADVVPRAGVGHRHHRAARASRTRCASPTPASSASSARRPRLSAISRRSDGVILDVNDVFLRELGFARGEVIGRTWAELGVWALDRRVGRAPRPGRSAGRRARAGHSLRRRSGAPFEGTLSVVSLRSRRGGVPARARRSTRPPGGATKKPPARASGGWPASMSDLPGMVYQCCVDPEWTMLSVSDGCRALTGYEPSDLVGNRVVSYGSLIVEEDREMVFAAVRDAIERGQPFRLAYRIRHASGDTRWVWEQGRVAESLLASGDDARGVDLRHHRSPSPRRGSAPGRGAVA